MSARKFSNESHLAQTAIPRAAYISRTAMRFVVALHRARIPIQMEYSAAHSGRFDMPCFVAPAGCLNRRHVSIR